jgi:hypothetical protein
MGASTTTPNVGMILPGANSIGWGPPLNANFSIIDAIFGGTTPVPELNVTGTITAGSVVAGSFSGLNGAYFLQSSLFNVANGIPQLNGAALIPRSLIAGSGIITVAYSAVPSFNAAQASVFNITLTGNVTASTFINGTSGSSIIAFRITQDATGNRGWTWPTNVRNGGTVDPGANINSTQLFLLQTDGSLDAASPMMYSTGS